MFRFKTKNFDRNVCAIAQQGHHESLLEISNNAVAEFVGGQLDTSSMIFSQPPTERKTCLFGC